MKIKQSRDKLIKAIEKELDDWGFKYYLRFCKQSIDIGEIDEDGWFIPDQIEVEEKWTNKDMAEFIVDDLIDGKLTPILRNYIPRNRQIIRKRRYYE